MYENAQDLLLLATSGGGLLSIVKGTGIVVRLTLLLLVLASVASWAIIIFKAVQMKRMFANSSSFLEYFWHSRKLDEIYENADNFSPCPVAEVFKDGYIELGKIQKARRQKMADSSAGMAELSGLDEDMESVERS
jgi:biopolymer transport protein TolQ